MLAVQVLRAGTLFEISRGANIIVAICVELRFFLSNIMVLELPILLCASRPPSHIELYELLSIMSVFVWCWCYTCSRHGHRRSGGAYASCKVGFGLVCCKRQGQPTVRGD